MENSFLFVYGSLRPEVGHPMGVRLGRVAHYLGGASVQGELYRVSWYPALIPGRGDVRGDVYGVPESLWSELDAFEEAEGENPEYRRELSTVLLDSGIRVEAWVYWYNRPVTGLRRLPGGDWLAAPS
jgi:gamma-glutamylcyclotransferase (GGCT)/AIG2-like uncharacterized protein YtfP